MNLKTSWKPIVGAAAALIITRLIGQYFGLAASLITLAALLLAWWGINRWYIKLLIQIERKINDLPPPERESFLSGISAEIRKDIEARTKLGK